MFYKQLVRKVAKETYMPYNITRKLMDRFIYHMEEGIIKDKKMIIHGLGTFKIKRLSAQTNMNIHTKQKIVVPAHDILTFRIGKELFGKLNPMTLKDYIKNTSTKENSKKEEKTKGQRYYFRKVY